MVDAGTAQQVDGVRAALAGTAIMNLVDDPLIAQHRKGALRFASELYNPGDAFAAVHHVSFNNLRDRRREQSFTLGHRIHVHVLHTTRPWLPMFWRLLDVPLCLWQIYWIARRHGVRLIRGRGPSYASFFGVIVSRWLRVPCVVSVGGDHRLARDLTRRYPVFNVRWIDAWIERHVLKRATRVFCPNEFSRQYVIRRGTDPERAVVLPLRLPEAIRNLAGAPEVLGPLGIRQGDPLVLFVGRFELDKQVDVLIEAMPAVLREVPETQFLFIGDGSLRPSLEARVRALGLVNAVRFTGFQPTEVIRACMEIASVIWISMSGWVVFEAAAAARPIVAFDVEWHSEFVEDGVTGRLVPNRDAVVMARTVAELLQHPDEALRLGQAARARLESRYDAGALIRRELELLSECLG